MLYTKIQLGNFCSQTIRIELIWVSYFIFLNIVHKRAENNYETKQAYQKNDRWRFINEKIAKIFKNHQSSHFIQLKEGMSIIKSSSLLNQLIIYHSILFKNKI
jgi:hypothetical protein